MYAVRRQNYSALKIRNRWWQRENLSHAIFDSGESLHRGSFQVNVIAGQAISSDFFHDTYYISTQKWLLITLFHWKS